MDQIAAALNVINNVSLSGLSTSINPTQGARLTIDGALDSLKLTASDGSLAGVTVVSEGFGIEGLDLPTPEDPSIALDPYVEHLEVTLAPDLFRRLAVFTREKVLEGFHEVVDRITLDTFEMAIRLTSEKVLHLDLSLKAVALCQEAEELIRIKDVSVSILHFDTKKPPKVALESSVVVLRSALIEIEQSFFERAISASQSEIPPPLERLRIELPGPKMVIDGSARLKVPISFRTDLRLETENDLFGIYFDRFYIPGTNMKLPGFTRNVLLGIFRGFIEKKMRGLVEASNESLRINPWIKIPVKIVTRVEKFAVQDGKIVIAFCQPTDREIPAKGVEQTRLAERRDTADSTSSPLAPGPAIYS